MKPTVRLRISGTSRRITDARLNRQFFTRMPLHEAPSAPLTLPTS